MAPNPADRYSRDRDVERSRRFRTGLVSAGVIGSLGVAAAAGYATVSSATGSSGSSGSSGAGSTFVFPQSQNNVSRGDDGGQERGDDGSGAFTGGQAPPLQQGSGTPPQGQTAGS